MSAMSRCRLFGQSGPWKVGGILHASNIATLTTLDSQYNCFMEMSGHESDILRCLDEGMSFDEIAQELDMTPEQVYQIGTAFFDRAFAIWTKTKI
jgi:DNA-binding NarL/FixJ family response regulator